MPACAGRPKSRSSSSAARIVRPVYSTSSTITTVRPSTPPSGSFDSPTTGLGRFAQALIELRDEDINGLIGENRHRRPDGIGMDRKLSSTAIDQHTQVDPRRTAPVGRRRPVRGAARTREGGRPRLRVPREARLQNRYLPIAFELRSLDPLAGQTRHGDAREQSRRDREHGARERGNRRGYRR